MMLLWLILSIMAGGLLAWSVNQWSSFASRLVALLGVFVPFIVSTAYWTSLGFPLDTGADSSWMTTFQVSWIPALGIDFYLALDGLSLLMIVLTTFIGSLTVLYSWGRYPYKEGFYYFNLLWVLAGITGVFLAMDLFLFYFFWEVMLIPMYFLIGIWGGENRGNAAFKFFIFTQAGGLLMLLSVLGLHALHLQQTGEATFAYEALMNTELTKAVAYPLMLGFLAGLLVKLPAFPLHTWLANTYTEAPASGSIILSGLMVKTAGYSLIRFVLPFFPEAVGDFAPIGMVLGVIGILYGAKLAFAQSDLKRIVSYSSFSHMGYIVLGIFAMNELALQGVVMQMIAHGISSTALFAMIGFLETRLHTRDVNQIGGLYSRAPVMGGVGLIFVMASLGLPGLGNFIAEFLVLMGAYQADILLAVFASIGLVLSSLYALRLMQNIFYGQVPDSLSNAQMADFRAKEGLIMGALIVVVIGLGFYPQPVFDTAQGSIKTITQPDQRPSAAQTTNQAESSASQAAKSELILKQNL
jgi:NADH-quinone oxidoreductase subunit M